MGVKKLSGLIVVAAIFCIAALAQAESYPPFEEALTALESDEQVLVTTESLPWGFVNTSYYVFEPQGGTASRGFIIYPGGLLDSRSYAPAARAIAEAGYLVIIVSMPFDLAPFGWKRANQILRKYVEVENWTLGGHSVGGSFSCKYILKYPEKINSLVLWASTPSIEFDLADTDVQAISIYGTNDYYPEQLAEAADFLPEGTPFVVIEGANHTQFGWYDTSPDPHQTHDYPADITIEEQQEKIVEATVDFLDGL
ncbi:MAG: alpha/beta fold hydrolase [Deltaproteobacteria bacterium]|nr:alpha/beta fold hydrolase [Deltaproteobacteria bacterium]